MSIDDTVRPNKSGAGRAYLRRVVAASMAGTIVEWYEFFLHGTAATLVFGKVFFAKGGTDLDAIFAAFVTYAVGFAARPAGRRRVRPTRRQVRAQEATAAEPGPGRHRDLPDGLSAHVRPDRLLGAGALGGIAVHSGLRRRRRVGRRRAVSRRAQPQRQPRLLGELAAIRCAGREPVGHRGAAGAHLDPVGHGVPELGLARGLLVVRGRGGDRLLHPDQSQRRAESFWQRWKRRSAPKTTGWLWSRR